jgi:dipeptidase E
MSTIVAIGGGELSKYETLLIDRKIISLSKKKHPNVLFIPTASGDAIEYWNTFKEVYKDKLGCKVDVLYILKERLSKKQIEEKISLANIIYVGGGDTLKMMRAWKKHGIDSALGKAYKRGVILSGLSAGAICWFRYGMSDSKRFIKKPKNSWSFMRISGLNLIPLAVSPHHLREKSVRNSGMKKMMQRTPGVGLAIDDNAAILIQDKQYEIIKSKQSTGIKKVFRKNNKVMSKPLAQKGSLAELVNK